MTRDGVDGGLLFLSQAQFGAVDSTGDSWIILNSADVHIIFLQGLPVLPLQLQPKSALLPCLCRNLLEWMFATGCVK